MNVVDKLITHHFHINSLEQTEDETIIKFKALVHTFEQTPNGWGITEDTASKRIHTLINKHIVTRYYSADENNGIDCLGDHENSETILRGTDDVKIPKMLTNSIGTITNAYIDYIDENNESLGKAVWAEGVLLAMENMNEVSLLMEWFEKDVKILISVEWWYTTSVKDNNGSTWIADPTYSNVCILNSEQRGDKPVIYGNYDYANIQLQFNQAIKADLESKESFNNISKNNIKNEIEKNGDDSLETNIFKKALNELSFGDIRDEIYSDLAKKMVAEEYNNIWISLYYVFENYFIYEVYEDSNWIYYKISYTKTETGVDVDLASKVKVERDSVWKEVPQVQALNTKIEELTIEITTKDESLNTLNTEKETLTQTISGLNSTIEELTPYKETVDTQEYEKALNEKKEYYSDKFGAVNAKEKFDTEEVQTLIKQTLNSEEGTKAELALNKMIVEMVQTITIDNKKEDSPQNSYKELNSNMNNLIPTKESFVKNYGFEIN